MSGKTPRAKTGELGEAIAARYVERAGMTLLARNYRGPHGEIDLVARDGEELVFVEVRTRRSAEFGSPEESLTQRKRGTMVACALAYLEEHGGRGDPWRIDLVAVELAGNRLLRVDHYKHALDS
jgi:putative endonuclease